jgi:hypothetical protein
MGGSFWLAVAAIGSLILLLASASHARSWRNAPRSPDPLSVATKTGKTK